MTITLAELAEQVGGRRDGPESLELTGAARLDMAGPTEISLADHADRSRDVSQSEAAAVIVSPDVDYGDKPAIVVDDVHAAFTTAVLHFRPQPKVSRSGVSPAATVSPVAV